MPEFLTFVLAAPLAAMGELAVGERRGSWDRPGRSTVLGLVAACLGLAREDDAGHAALEAGYGLALRRERIGPLLADYHTAQVPPRQRGRRFATRAEELAVDDLETILSRRDYRSDLLVFAALWPRLPPLPLAGEGGAGEGPTGEAGGIACEGRGEGQPWPLADIAAAMRSPAFVPYLGRKSCPLMLPLAPELASAGDPAAALAARAASLGEWARKESIWSAIGRGEPVLAMDYEDARNFRLDVQLIERRRDIIVSRRRWQFALRDEAIVTVSP